MSQLRGLLVLRRMNGGAEEERQTDRGGGGEREKERGSAAVGLSETILTRKSWSERTKRVDA